MTTFLHLLKSRPLEFYALTVLVIFATISTNGQTIALGLIPILVYLFYHAKPRAVSAELQLFATLFAAIFILNFCAVFNFADFRVDIPHPDYHFYAKIATYFNAFGVENYLNAKHLLLQETDFAMPYRGLDTWILALINSVSPFSDVIALQLIFRPLIFTAVSFTFYQQFKDTFKSQVLLFATAVLINFFLADFFTSWFLEGEKLALISVSSYPKLWIYYLVFIRFLSSIYQHDWRNNNAILYLVLLPLLVQTTFHLYLIVALWMVFDYKYFLKNYKLSLAIVSSVIYFGVFYYWNQLHQTEFYNVTLTTQVTSFSEFYKAFGDCITDVVRNGGWLLSTFILIAMLISRRKADVVLFGWALAIIFTGMLLGTFLHQTADAYQFYLNLVPPTLSVVFLVILLNLNFKRNIIQIGVCLVAFVGFVQQQFTIGFYNTKSIWNNDIEIVNRFKEAVKEDDFPLGVTYYKNTIDNFNEHFNQRGADLLFYQSARFDVVNLRGIEFAEFNKSQANSAISIWRKQQNIQTKTGVEERFLNAFPFGFLFTDCQISELPPYLSSRVIQESRIPLYGTSFYKLK